MSTWMPWLIILFVLIGVAYLQVGVYASYISDEFKVKLIVGKLRFSLKDADGTEKKQSEKKTTVKKQGRAPKKKSPWITVLFEHWQEALEMVGRVLTAPCLELLVINITVGDPEPDRCVLKYGRICAAAGSLLPPLENTFQVKKRQISITPTFEDNGLKICAEAALTLRIHELIALAWCVLRFGLHLYRYIKFEKKVVQKV